jgi:hypothetical protein
VQRIVSANVSSPDDISPSVKRALTEAGVDVGQRDSVRGAPLMSAAKRQRKAKGDVSDDLFRILQDAPEAEVDPLADAAGGASLFFSEAARENAEFNRGLAFELSGPRGDAPEEDTGLFSSDEDVASMGVFQIVPVATPDTQPPRGDNIYDAVRVGYANYNGDRRDQDTRYPRYGTTPRGVVHEEQSRAKAAARAYALSPYAGASLAALPKLLTIGVIS